jgi:proteasome lid subunit RPN8/RPN11
MIARIASGLTEQLLRAAAESPDEEICGLLLGQPGHIEALRPARNVAADRRRRFEIEPARLLAVHREARGLGHRVIGHYHSHPDGSALPSARDAARAVQDGQLWLIVAGGSVTAWRAVADAEAAEIHGRFAPVHLESH